MKPRHKRLAIIAAGVVALAIAWLWLGERIDGAKIAGAAAILSGVVLSRLAAGDLRRRLPGPPAEE